MPIFPDVHEEVDTHASGKANFSLVDGAEARGYASFPLVTQVIVAHLCASSLWSKAVLHSKLCWISAHIAENAYNASGDAASALHTMAVLQVFQAKLLQSLDGEEPNPEGIKDLHAATDCY